MLENNIPGYMSGSQPKILFDLVKDYNNINCIGVEIGSLFGRSSSVLAQAIPDGKLYCIDPWENNKIDDQGFSEEYIAINNFPKTGMVSNLEIFKEYTKKFTNIIPIQGFSPQCCSTFNFSVDFVFLDALHCNPSDRDNIDFWLPKIKSRGLFIGHDYNNNFLDVLENVQYLETKLNKKVTTSVGNGSLWWFQI